MDNVFYGSTSCTGYNKSAIEVVESFAKAGIKNIELGPTHFTEKNLILSLIELQKKYGLNYILHACFPPREDELFINLSSQNKEILESSIGHIKHMIDVAVKLNSPMVTFHAGFRYDPKPGVTKYENENLMSYDTAYRTYLSSVKKIVSHAKKNKIKIGFEPNVISSNNLIDGKNPRFIMAEIQEIENLFRDLNDDYLGILLDLGHLKVTANNLGYDANDFVKRVEKHVIEIHIHDNNGIDDQHLKLDSGCWALEKIKNHFRKGTVITCEVGKLSPAMLVEQIKLIQKWRKLK